MCNLDSGLFIKDSEDTTVNRKFTLYIFEEYLWMLGTKKKHRSIGTGAKVRWSVFLKEETHFPPITALENPFSYLHNSWASKVGHRINPKIPIVCLPQRYSNSIEELNGRNSILFNENEKRKRSKDKNVNEQVNSLDNFLC